MLKRLTSILKEEDKSAFIITSNSRAFCSGINFKH